MGHVATTANFAATNDGEEISLEYKIGTGRKTDVKLFKTDCNVGDELTASNGITKASPDTDTNIIAADPSYSKFEVFLNVIKNATVLGDLYSGNTLSFCVQVYLLNSNDDVIKFNKTNVEVTLDFNNTFEIDNNIELSQIYVGDDTVATQVLDYVQACACNPGADDVSCDEGVKVITGEEDDDRLKVCVYSTSEEMKINYLDRLVLEAGSNYVIVDGQDSYDDETATVRKYPGWNGVYAESIVPTSYFSYNNDVLAKVTGVVFLKLAGSRRRLAVELTGHESDVIDGTPGASRALQSAGDQESAFAVNVALQKSELDDADVNGAVDTFRSGFIVAVAGFAVAMMM